MRSFLDLLPELGQGLWRDFFQVASQTQEISLYRPFYPRTPGGLRFDHLLLELELDRNSLYRQCELRQAYRRPASPLFWTMGAQQVGKAALHGWQTVLQPALALTEPHVGLWPFSGRLAELLQPGKAVIAEIYPAEYYHRLGISLGKRSPAARSENATALLAWARENDLELDSQLETTIRLGFPGEQGGEDAFDAVIGLLGMLAALYQSPATLEPGEDRIRNIEGWILGQPVGEKWN